MRALIPHHVRLLAAVSVVALFLVLQLALSFRLNINWDEYWFLSRVFASEQHRLSDPLQTFHVHLLAPVSALPGSDSDRITAGRLIMIGCECASLAGLFTIARRYADAASAWLVLAAWCAGGFALVHGASFRTDPLAAAFMMGSLALLFSNRSGRLGAVAAGLLAALGLLVTIKAIFFLPAFVAAFLHACHDRASLRPVVRRFAIASGTLLLAGGLLWLWHSGSLATHAARLPGATAASAAGIGKAMLVSGWFPARQYIAAWLLGGAALTLLLVCGVAIEVREASRGIDRRTKIELLLCAAPLLGLIVYRNAYPYFFPFIALPVVLAAIPAARVVGQSVLAFPVLIAVMLGTVLLQASHKWPADQTAQRAYESAAHLAFPKPVAYIDRNGILPSYDGGNQLLSAWGLAGLQPNFMITRITREQPPLLILNSPALEAAVDPRFTWRGLRLSPVDEAALRATYIPHWGKLWVAGVVIADSANDVRFQLPVGGRYTVECSGSRVIDDALVECGRSIELTRGVHRWKGRAGTLRWGHHLPRPATAPPREPIYYGF